MSHLLEFVPVSTPPTAPQRIAFFDLDRTLLACNTATLWIRRQVREGQMKRRSALRGAGWMGAYYMGFAGMDQAIRDAVATLEGQDEGDLVARTEAFWGEEVVGQVRPGAVAAIARHRAEDALLVLLTGSSTYMSRQAARQLDLHGALCNRFEVRDGEFTGKAAEPLCFGAGKLVYARQLAADAGVALDACAFYTDSYSDVPVLEAVGQPVAVHPDPRLLREARKRGWRVETWDGPQPEELQP